MKKIVPITNAHLCEVAKEYSKDPRNAVLRHALSKTAIPDVVHSKDSCASIKPQFSIDIKTMGATNQKQSGRCWIFAATNVLREIIAKKCDIKEFEISQAHFAFYDRLEKINFALESIIDLIDVDYDDRVLQHVLTWGVGDGGQWDMFVNIVKKYGICPKLVNDETTQSDQTWISASLINANIRKFASDARIAYKKGGMEKVRKLQAELMDKCYKLLVNCYGLPVDKFDFEYVDSKNAYHIEKGFTPKSFFDKYIGSELDEYVSVINAPTASGPYEFNKSYTIAYLGNVVEGNGIRHLNVSMPRLKELIIAQLKDQQITWFGSDVSFYGERKDGIWDDATFDYKSAFDLEFKMDKGEGLKYRYSAMNHAMVITGVNLDDKGVPTKWKIENSWGNENGNKGYYIMSASWFDMFTYQAAIKRKYLSPEELKAYNTKPIVLKPWDPMGTLAD